MRSAAIELRFITKLSILLTIALAGERYFPDELKYKLATMLIFYGMAVLLLTKEDAQIPVNITLLFKDKKPPEDDDKNTRNFTLEI